MWRIIFHLSPSPPFLLSEENSTFDSSQLSCTHRCAAERKGTSATTEVIIVSTIKKNCRINFHSSLVFSGKSFPPESESVCSFEEPKKREKLAPPSWWPGERRRWKKQGNKQRRKAGVIKRRSFRHKYKQMFSPAHKAHRILLRLAFYRNCHNRETQFFFSGFLFSFVFRWVIARWRCFLHVLSSGGRDREREMWKLSTGKCIFNLKYARLRTSSRFLPIRPEKVNEVGAIKPMSMLFCDSFSSR